MLLTWGSSQGLNALVNSAEFIAPLVTDVSLSRGTGSATFTRATTATVTDHEGVVRPVLSGEVRFQGARRVRNYVVASEDLMNAGWTVAGTGVKVSATEFSFPAINGGVTQTFTVAVGDRVSFSVTLSGSGTITLVRANFGADLQVTLTATPQRFVIDGVATATSVGPYVYRRPGDTATSATIKYMQFENVTGQSNQNPSEYVSVGVLSSPFHGAMVDGVKYFSTTNGNTVASNVVTEASGSPISADTLKGYLAEGARTNLLTYSEQFDNVLWLKGSVTVSADATVSPDGTTTADLFYPTTSGVNREIYQAHGLVAGSVALSVYAKAGGLSWIGVGNNGTLATAVFFNVSTGTVGTAAAGYTGTIDALPNGWYRCKVIYTGVATNFLDVFLADSDNTVTVTKSGTNGVYLWGAQAEAGSFASSYIPTTTASVPRNADVLTYPSAGNILAAVGTCYAEIMTGYTIAGGFRDFVGAGAGVGANTLGISSGAASTTILTTDGTTVINKGGLSDMSTAVRKRASAWGGSTYGVTGDGLAPATGGFDGGMPVGANIGIGCNGAGTGQESATIRNVRIYSTQLSASQLQAVTA